MKGTFIHVVEKWEHCNCLNEVQQTSKTEQKVDWINPGRELWNIMSEDMFKVYEDTDHTDITLEDGIGYFPKDLIDRDQIQSWAGFSYSDYNSVDDDYTRIWHLYIFI